MKWIALAVFLLPAASNAQIYDVNAKKDPMYKYYACVNNEAVKYSKSSEPAEVAATAAIQSCSSYEEKHIFRGEIADALSPSQKNELSKKLHEKAKPFAVKVILDERLKQSSN
ncbi:MULTISPECIES: hypothetical protein [Serratia]|uniref:hypothetical protein n=1 Tax=Serratia TaxID=613 RepID=UPI0021BABEBC|nr:MULTISPECIES: hypothetical protein [Serratia]MDT0208090.1 hypothetical protein [Serratia marcescens]